MDLEARCKDKLLHFRIKELKDVLTQLGLSKQGKKQELVERILTVLSDGKSARLWSKRNTVAKEEVARLVDDTYRKIKVSGASDLASKAQVSSDTSNLKVKGEPEASFQPEMKVRCVCGSSLETESMIQCDDPRCHVWEHVGCVFVPEKPMDGNPPLPESFYCEVCRLTRADPFWVTVAHPLYPVRLTATNIPTDGSSAMQSVERTFQITRADKDLLAKQEYDVQAWCMLLNDKVLFRMQWPQHADLQINGMPVRAIYRPGSQLLGANGRDDGPIITPFVRDGINRISLSRGDSRSFCFGVRLVKRRTLQQVLNLIPEETKGETFEDALARVRRCIGGGGGDDNADSDSDIEVVADFFGVNLRCPMSGSRIKVAGRFLPCKITVMSLPDRAVLSLLADIFLSFDGAILGVTLAFGAVRAASKYASASAALNKIKDSPEVSVSDLRSLIPPSDGESSPGNQRVVVVRGTVEPKVTGDGSHKNNNDNNVLISQETGEKALIIHRTQTYMYSGWKTLFHLSSGHRFLLERSLPKQGADFMRMVPFVIVDKNQWSQSSFLVVNMDGARQPLPLTTVYNRLQPINSSPYSFLQALFFPEYPVGMLDVEKILPPGRDLTALGICSFNNGVPEIKSCQDLPYFLSDMTKDKMIMDLTETTSVLFWGGVIMGCLSVGILGFAAVSAWNRWKLRRELLQRRPDQHMVDDETEEDADEIPDGELCVICVTRRRIPAFIPCGHVVCCRYCALTVERGLNPKCPVCLQAIRGSMRIYYS